MFKCSNPPCDKAYATEVQLTEPIKRKHSVRVWRPRKRHESSDDKEHDADEVFEDENSLINHKRKFHDMLAEPQGCPLKTVCRSDKVFTQKRQISNHLQRVHNVLYDQVDQPERAALSCIIDGCRSSAELKNASALRSHLARVHKMKQDEVYKLVPTRAQETAQAPLNPICPVEGCRPTAKFKRAEDLRSHLAQVHKMNPDGVYKLVPNLY
jgi:hypothetical protein